MSKASDKISDLARLQRSLSPTIDGIEKAQALVNKHNLSAAAGIDSPLARAASETHSAYALATSRAAEEAARFKGVADLSANAAQRLVEENAHRFTTALGLHSEMQKVTQQIEKQQKAIADLRPSLPAMRNLDDSVRIPEIRVPPNPLHETNKRLKSIEQRFDRMEEIALNGAEIATGLQKSAANFLVKFEVVAEGNDRTTKRAVWIGVLAILVAVVTPIFQVVYTEVYRAPIDSASNQSAISDVKREISDLRDTQKAALDKLTEVLTQDGKEQANSLREIRDLLARRNSVEGNTKPPPSNN